MISSGRRKAIVTGVVLVTMILGAAFGPFRIIRIATGSMEPALSVGSFWVVNRFVDYKKIREGDVVVFSGIGTHMAAHRVVRVLESGLITKGDANDTEDFVPVTRETFRGKIIFAPSIG